MKKEIKIPQISEDADEATVAKVHVSEGDDIRKGDDLIAVESDKASVDIPNEEGDGTVKEIKVSEGDTVHVGDVILILEMAGEDDEEEEEEDSDAADKEEKEKKKGKDKKEKKKPKSDPEDDEGDEKDESEEDEGDSKADEEGDEKEEETDDSEEEGESDEEVEDALEGEQERSEKSGSANAPAAPLARKFARELGIDITDLRSGDPEHRITREDVMAYAKKLIQSAGHRTGGSVEPIELPDFSQWGETEREPLSGIRTAVAKNTTLSWQNIPHVTQHDKADITELQHFREKLAEQDRKLSITALFAKITVEALQKFPRFNSSLDMRNRELILKKYYNLGIAVDTEDGLLMPVIKHADQKSLEELNEELQDLAQKARDRKLKPAEMRGGNFSISNLGGIGGSAFTPVIFPPQVAILGISQPQVEARWLGDEFVPADICTLSLSYDHRVIDGADAARFLRWICEVIEEPLNLL